MKLCDACKQANGLPENPFGLVKKEMKKFVASAQLARLRRIDATINRFVAVMEKLVARSEEVKLRLGSVDDALRGIEVSLVSDPRLNASLNRQATATYAAGGSNDVL